MTTRLKKVSTKPPRKVVVSVLCPSCRGITRAQAVGHAVVDGKRMEALRCLTDPCSLVWVPTRSNIPAAA